MFWVLFFFILNLQASEIEIKAGFLEKTLVEGKEKTILKSSNLEKASISIDNKKIISDYIEIYGEDNNFIKSNTYSIIIDNENELTLKGSSFFYDRKLDFLKMSDNVELEDNKEKIIIKCGLLENFGKKDIANMQLNVRIFKKDMVTRSEFAIYKREKKELELYGFPIVYNKDDKYSSSKIFIDLETENIILQGEIKGYINQEESGGIDESN